MSSRELWYVCKRLMNAERVDGMSPTRPRRTPTIRGAKSCLESCGVASKMNPIDSGCRSPDLGKRRPSCKDLPACQTRDAYEAVCISGNTDPARCRHFQN